MGTYALITFIIYGGAVAESTSTCNSEKEITAYPGGIVSAEVLGDIGTWCGDRTRWLCRQQRYLSADNIIPEIDLEILSNLAEKEQETQRVQTARREKAKADATWMKQVLVMFLPFFTLDSRVGCVKHSLTEQATFLAIKETFRDRMQFTAVGSTMNQLCSRAINLLENLQRRVCRKKSSSPPP
eukprot:sb/3471476/